MPIDKEKLKRDKDLRAKKCFEELERICKQYNCSIEPVTTITKSGVQAGINIIAN